MFKEKLEELLFFQYSSNIMISMKINTNFVLASRETYYDKLNFWR